MLLDWQIRVYSELSDLQSKIGKLDVIVQDPNDLFSAAESDLLSWQLTAMRSYESILLERIRSWPSQ